MGVTEQDLSFLHKEPLLRVQGIFSCKRRTADIQARHPEGLLMYETRGEIYMLFAESKAAVRELVEQLPETDILLSDYPPMDDTLMKQRGFTFKAPCINVVYQKKTPIPVQTEIRLGPLAEGQVSLIAPHYHSYDPETLALFIREGQLLGGYLGETLVGFIGWHDEGAMGMLHVFEEHRRKGYAAAMEALQANLMLSRGELPHGQVYVGNEASLALQKKLGFTLADQTVCWFFKDKE